MRPLRSLFPVAGSLAVCFSGFALPAQQPGPAPGYRLIGLNGSFDTDLIDTSGNVIHSWPGGTVPGLAFALDPNDGQLVRTMRTPVGPVIALSLIHI